MVCDVLAYTNIPAVVLANVNANRVRSHDYTCANIAVAEQHPVEERGARGATHDHVPSGNLKSIETLSRREPLDAVLRNAGNRRHRREGCQSRGLKKLSPVGSHSGCFLKGVHDGPSKTFESRVRTRQLTNSTQPNSRLSTIPRNRCDEP